MLQTRTLETPPTSPLSSPNRPFSSLSPQPLGSSLPPSSPLFSPTKALSPPHSLSPEATPQGSPLIRSRVRFVKEEFAERTGVAPPATNVVPLGPEIVAPFAPAAVVPPAPAIVVPQIPIKLRPKPRAAKKSSAPAQSSASLDLGEAPAKPAPKPNRVLPKAGPSSASLETTTSGSGRPKRTVVKRKFGDEWMT